MDRFAAAGLGLDKGVVLLARTTPEWLRVGADLRDEVAARLAPEIARVEQIGSASVEGLLAKPITDLAAGVHDEQQLDAVHARLIEDGWSYRGDAGDSGGHVFVLETRPQHRVAHLHLVDPEASQWRDYLAVRDLLRQSPDARLRYEQVKLELARLHPFDRPAYTIGKDDIVRSLLVDRTSG